MMDLRMECVRARDLLFVLPVTNWNQHGSPESSQERVNSGTHHLWAEAFPGWAQDDYVERRLATAAHFIQEYLRDGRHRHLSFTARYINLFFGDDEAWDRAVRDIVASQLNESRAWADAWRAELLSYGYQFAVAGAYSPPGWLDDEDPAAPPLGLDLTDVPLR